MKETIKVRSVVAKNFAIIWLMVGLYTCNAYTIKMKGSNRSACYLLTS